MLGHLSWSGTHFGLWQGVVWRVVGLQGLDWLERLRLVLISEGFTDMERELKLLSGLKEKQRSAVNSLVAYLYNNADRLPYCERLAAGRVIGSGLIEGTCKNLVDRCLKQTGACWRLPRANRIACFCAVLYSSQWKACWKKSH